MDIIGYIILSLIGGIAGSICAYVWMNNGNDEEE